MNPTSVEVKLFWNYMQEYFSTDVVNKENAAEMEIVASILDTLKIVDKEKFLSRFSTTIGRRIYTPFNVGEDSLDHNLWGQIVTCVHEHQHVVQHDKDGLKYEIDYVINVSDRIKYECEAYRCNQELNWWRFNNNLNAIQLASVLKNYGCNDSQIDIAGEVFTLNNVSIRQGIIINEASKVAIEWLDKNLSHLKEQ